MEAQDIVLHYGLITDELGNDAELAINEAIDNVAEDPEGWPFLSESVRRFPYLVVYAFESKHITVIAISHESRRPGYWIDRLD